MIDHAKRLREIYGWLADPTDFVMVKRTAFEAADEIDRLKARVTELEALTHTGRADTEPCGRCKGDGYERHFAAPNTRCEECNGEGTVITTSVDPAGNARSPS